MVLHIESYSYNLICLERPRGPAISESISYHCAVKKYIELNLNVIVIGSLKCGQIYPHIMLIKMRYIMNIAWFEMITCLFSSRAFICLANSLSPSVNDFRDESFKMFSGLLFKISSQSLSQIGTSASGVGEATADPAGVGSPGLVTRGPFSELFR